MRAHPAAPVPFGLGRVAAPVYGAIVARRNAQFDLGRRVVDVGVPVISVGNLSVGGTGKTPMTAHLVRTLLRAGRRPAIAMRGYRAQRGEMSDEQAEYARVLPGTPVIARPDRAAGIREHLKGAGAARTDCIVLDDGFQHRFVKRDLDIVLVDATRDPMEERLLPAGWLREPVESLRRADFIVMTHAEAVSAAEIERLADAMEKRAGVRPVAVCAHEWPHFETPEGRCALDGIEGRRVFAVCALGNPAPFIADIVRAGAVIAGAAALRDHARYTADLMNRIFHEAALAQADVILTTMKDWVKIERVIDVASAEGRGGEPPIWRAALALRFVRGEEALGKAVVAAAGGRAAAAASASGGAAVLSS